MPRHESSDFELLARWRDGDRSAGNDLIERHFARIKRFFENKVSEEQAVKELLQVTFKRCVEKLDDFEGRSSFYTFLYGIARNVFLEHCRQRKSDERIVDLGEAPLVDLAPGPFTYLGANRERKLLINVLRRLPFDMQVVVELYFFEKLPASQVAEVIARPEGTVRGRIRSARKQIEELVRELAESPDELESTLATLGTWAQKVRQDL